MRKFVQALARRASWDVMRIGERSYAVAPLGSNRDAWFSFDLQRRTLLANQRVDLVIDVGANEGQFACTLRQHYVGELLSVEPAAEPFERLQARAAGDAAWHVERCALGAEAGELELRISNLSVFNSFLPTKAYCDDQFGGKARITRTERVPVCRLDAIIGAAVPDFANRRIFLKMDTQGFDLQVFRGARAVLPQIVGLQSEVSVRQLYDGAPDWLDVLGEYQTAGFAVAALAPASQSRDGWPIEYDCLMIRSVP